MAKKPQIIKVAARITEYSLAFNAGLDKGIGLDDVVTLYREVAVKDPDNEELLGIVRVPKLTLRVTGVEDKLSVGDVVSTFGPRGGGVSAVLFQPDRRHRVTTEPHRASDEVVLVRIGEEAEVAPRRTTS